MSGPVDVDIYAGDVDLTGLASFSGVQLRSMPRPAPMARYDAILGRDILNNGVVRMDGRTKELLLTF
jgi:hypothetical protein